MSDKTIQILGKEISRRDALKVGGIAGLGLAFSKPLMESIRPEMAFGQNYNTAPTGVNTCICEIFSKSADGVVILIMDGTHGITEIEVLEKSGVWYNVPSFTPGTTDPIYFTVNKFGDPSYIKIGHTAGNGVTMDCEFSF